MPWGSQRSGHTPLRGLVDDLIPIRRRALGLIGSRGHLRKGGYAVSDGRLTEDGSRRSSASHRRTSTHASPTGDARGADARKVSAARCVQIGRRIRRDVGGVIGGEGGIRTLPGHLESVSYRNHIAAVAMNAVAAVAHCPPVPADTPLDQSKAPSELLNAGSARFLTKRDEILRTVPGAV